MNASKLHERLEGAAPIFGVSIGNTADKSTWRVDFKPAATAPQRAAAQAVIDGWGEADWEGTAAERRRNRLEEMAALHARVLALEREKTQNPGAAAALQALIDQAQARIEALRPQAG